MELISAIAGQYLAGPPVRAFTRNLGLSLKHSVAAPARRILPGCVRTILDSTFHLGNVDIVQFLKDVWVQ